jgi:hypothetical protein
MIIKVPYDVNYGSVVLSDECKKKLANQDTLVHVHNSESGKHIGEAKLVIEDNELTSYVEINDSKDVIDEVLRRIDAGDKLGFSISGKNVESKKKKGVEVVSDLEATCVHVKSMIKVDEFGNYIPDADRIEVYTCKCKKAVFLEYFKNKEIIISICKQNIYLKIKGSGNAICGICDGELIKDRTVKLKNNKLKLPALWYCETCDMHYEWRNLMFTDNQSPICPKCKRHIRQVK